MERARGGTPPPPHFFLDQTEVRRAEKNFLGDRLGSGPAIRQCVTISLCRHPTLLSETFVHVFREECRVITQRIDTYLM